MPAGKMALTSPDALPTLLLSAPDVGAALSSDDVVVTTDVSKAWNDSAHFADVNCLAIAGAAQQGVYASSGSTAGGTAVTLMDGACVGRTGAGVGSRPEVIAPAADDAGTAGPGVAVAVCWVADGFRWLVTT